MTLLDSLVRLCFNFHVEAVKFIVEEIEIVI
jgi:hypothetical protein